MQSKISLLVKNVLLICMLVTFIAVPLFFNMHAYRSFTLDKALFLQWIGVMTLGLLFVLAINGRSSRVPLHSSFDTEFILTVLAPLVLYQTSIFLGTFFSIHRETSLIGSYERMRGVGLYVSYMTLFLVVLVITGKRSPMLLLIDTLVASSIPISLYGLMQHFGIATIDAALKMTNVKLRIISTLGNPLFLADYLAVVLFLSLYRLVDIVMRPEADWNRHPARNLALTSMYMLAVFLQFTSIILSQSRIASLALLIVMGFIISVPLFRTLGKSRQLFLYGMAVFVGIALIAGLLARNSPVFDIIVSKDVPLLSRIFYMGSVKDRLDVWESAVKALSPFSALRLPSGFNEDGRRNVHHLFGYGPDTLEVVLHQFSSPRWTTTSWDRSHNEFLDVGIENGLVGLFAYIWLFLGAIYIFLASLFRRHRGGTILRAVVLVSVFIVVGSSTVVLVDRSFRLVFPLMPWFALVGVNLSAGWLAYLERRQKEIRKSEGTSEWLPLFLGAAIMAHYLTEATSIVTPASGMVFWVVLGMLVAWFYQLRLQSAAPQPKHQRSRSTPSAPWIANTVVVPMFVVLLFSSLAYILIFYFGPFQMSAFDVWIANFTTMPTYAQAVFYGWPKLVVVILSALSASVILAPRVARSEDDSAFGKSVLFLFSLSLSAFALASFLLSGWYASVFALIQQGTAQGDLTPLLPQLAYFSRSYYLLLASAILIVLTVVGFRYRSDARQRSDSRAVISFAVLLLLGFGILVRYVIPASVADVYFKYGRLLSNPEQYAPAEQIFPRVLALVDYRAYYYFFYGDSLLYHMKKTKTFSALDLDKSERLMKRAIALDPFDSNFRKELANLYLVRYEVSGQKDQAALKKAVASARAAALLWPNNASRRIFYATVLLKAGEKEEALEQIRWAVRLNPNYAAGAIKSHFKDYDILYRTALLYQDLGRAKDALRLATQARNLASNKQQKEQVEALIASLQQQNKPKERPGK